jgi:hypothetical protein
MAFKVNYGQQRNERDRAKRAKQQEKLKKREEDAARRKAGREEHVPGAANGIDPDASEPDLQ